MKTDRREHKIISLLESRGEMTVNDLSRVLDVSLSTLRKQLAVMQSMGLVIRTYRGVMPVNRVPDETFDSKLHKNMSEKRRIAVKARTMINSVETISLGSGTASAELQLPRALFYQTLSEQSGFDVADDGDLMRLLTELSAVKADYDKVSSAIRDARETGYGVVVPTVDELILEEPEIMKQGGRYGVRLKASAPSIHMIRANIETTVSPIVGNEKQSEDMVNYLLQEFEGDTAKIWQSNIFGRSFHEIVSEDLQAKLKRMPDDARAKLRQTLERIINEGSGGLICIIL